MSTLIFAHRGASADRPENTLEAFALAIKYGADGFELDVHLTRDGHIVASRDYTINRVSDGTGTIEEMDLDILRQYNFAKYISGQKPCMIPTLTNVYELIADTKHIVNVELKTMERPYERMPEKLIQLEKEFNMTGRVLYSSVNHYSLQAIKEISPDAEVAPIYNIPLVKPWEYAKTLGASTIHPGFEVIKRNPQIVELCHQNGIKVNVYVPDDSPTEMEYLMKLGVNGILTNKPNVAYFVRDDLN